MNKLMFLSVSLLALTLSRQSYAQTCSAPPSCETLGYTNTTACDGGLKCPFENKWNCTASNLVGQIEELKQMLKNQNCTVGAIFYSDKTCASGLINGKTAIGVVIYVDGQGHGQVMAKDQFSSIWGHSTKLTDIAGLPNKTTAAEAELDLASCQNTEVIISAGSSYYYPAAWKAHQYTTAGTEAGDWCLPAAGVLVSLKNNIAAINSSLAVIGGTEIDVDAFGSYNYNYELWSSTEYDEKDVWVLNFVDGLYNHANSSADKDYRSHDVRPVLEF